MAAEGCSYVVDERSRFHCGEVAAPDRLVEKAQVRKSPLRSDPAPISTSSNDKLNSRLRPWFFGNLLALRA